MEDRGLDLKAYWHIFRRWWWIFAVGAVGMIIVAFFMTGKTVPIYEAEAKILVEGGQPVGGAVRSLADIQAAQELAKNYSDLVKTRPVLNQIIEELSLPYGPNTLAGKIGISTPRSLIVIKVRDLDPQLSAEIANATARSFIDQFHNRQLTNIALFQAALGQFNISQDPSIIAAQAATMRTFDIVEEALPSSSRSNPPSNRRFYIAAVLGLLAAGIVVFLIEYLDTQIKSPEELTAVTGMMVLGTVVRQQSNNGLGPISLHDESRRSALAESYKFLQTNLEFAAMDTQGVRTLLITSSSPEEGKTTTAANLAISLARLASRSSS